MPRLSLLSPGLLLLFPLTTSLPPPRPLPRRSSFLFAQSDPFRPAVGSVAPAIVNTLTNVLSNRGDAEKAVRQALRRLEAEAREERAALEAQGLETASHAASQRQRRRALAQCVFGVCVWKGALEDALRRVGERPEAAWLWDYGEQGRVGLPLNATEPLTLLARSQCLLALYLWRVHAVFATDEASARVPEVDVDFVDEEVKGVLRLALTDEFRDELAAVSDLAVRHSVPAWLAERLEKDLGRDVAAAFLATANAPGPTVLRGNPRWPGGRAGLAAELRDAGYEARETRDSPLGLLLVPREDAEGRLSLQSLEAWKNGAFEVQAEGSQLACLALRPRGGDVLVDYCAGRGGKALTLAALQAGDDAAEKGHVCAHDTDETALKQIPASARRGGVEDRIRPDPFRQHMERARRESDGADAVLVDAPCSSVGVLRRHPSLRWQGTPEKVAELRETQLGILTEAAGFVRPGGILVYSTCSVLRQENQEVADAFLAGAAGSDFEILPFGPDDNAWEWDPATLQALSADLDTPDAGPRPHELLLLPNVHGSSYDGFFVARFRRRAA